MNGLLLFRLSGLALGSLLLAATALAQDANPPAGAPGVIVEGSGNVSVGGQPAARKGDRTDDGQAAVEGSSNVFINGGPPLRLATGPDAAASPLGVHPTSL